MFVGGGNKIKNKISKSSFIFWSERKHCLINLLRKVSYDLHIYQGIVSNASRLSLQTATSTYLS